jgi:hypothetical protein
MKVLTNLLIVAGLAFGLATCNDVDFANRTVVFDETAAAPYKPLGQDNYRFDLYPNVQAFNSEVARRGITIPGKYIVAFAETNAIRNTCVVHIVDPAVHYNPAFLGHEITHCLYGNFHFKQDR